MSNNSGFDIIIFKVNIKMISRCRNVVTFYFGLTIPFKNTLVVWYNYGILKYKRGAPWRIG